MTTTADFTSVVSDLTDDQVRHIVGSFRRPVPRGMPEDERRFCAATLRRYADILAGDAEHLRDELDQQWLGYSPQMLTTIRRKVAVEVERCQVLDLAFDLEA